ncbi:MAG: SLBB domain-containing protein [Acidobacteria bacterium]|nr:SLBB domain-containing protein [Acidobacteriota bacterium]
MNSSKNSPRWIIGVIFCLLMAGSSLSVTAQAPAAAESVQTMAGGRNYRIGPGDVLSVEVAGEPDLKRKVKVSEQGTIRMPYIDQDLPVAGMSEHQVANLLREKLTVILKDPQVTLFIDEYHARMASIAGEVKEPKQIALTRELRLYDLISLAGGLTDKAGNIIQLIHTRPDDSIEVIDVRDLVRRPDLNRVIRDGDFVNVPETGVIYVTGNVNKPGVFPMKDTIKLSQAIAMAGGVSQDSKKKEVHLVRATDASQTVTTDQIVNLLDIEKDPTKDIVLRPYDVIMVPEATRAKQTRSLVQAFAGGLASALGWGVLR